MQEIRLQLKKSGVANLALGSLIALSGVWLAIQLKDSLSTSLIFGLCLSLLGLVFVILGVKSIRTEPYPIRFGGNTLKMPRNAASNEIVKFNTGDIIEYGVKSYMLPYIKIFEVRSASEMASISLEAFVEKKDIAILSKFLGKGQC